jgi:protein required for attachment to host cells
MPIDIPHNTFVVVADGAGARFLRNAGDGAKLQLIADGGLQPVNIDNDGPAGHRPKESSDQETHEAAFAKQLANELYRRAHLDDFSSLVLIADPQTLGQIRPSLHKEVRDRMVRELNKTLTKATIADIERSLLHTKEDSHE